MAFSRYAYLNTFNSVPKLSTSRFIPLSRSYTSFNRPVNALNLFKQNKPGVLLAAPRNSKHEEQRRSYSDFGQIPARKKINPIWAYSFIAGGTVLSFLLYTYEPNFRQLEVRTEGIPSNMHSRANVQLPLTPDYSISPIWRRIVAFLIDNTLISILFQGAHLLLAGQYEAMAVPLAVLGSFAYEVLSYVYADGKTVGKYLTNIKVVTENHTPITYGVAIKYTLAKLLNLFIMIDALYGAFDISGDKKCIHNVFSRTVVIHDSPVVVAKSNTTVVSR